MRLRLLFGLVFFVTFHAISQDKKWSIEANYPIPVGNSFFEDFNGIADFGIRYRAFDVSFMKLGASLNGGYFKYDIVSEEVQGVYNFKSYLVQPNIFAEFHLKPITRLHPSVGIGYSILHTNLEGSLEGELRQRKVTDGGLNFNFGVSYDLSQRLFIQFRYDHTLLNAENGNNGIHEDDGIGILKAGFGFRF